MINICDKSISFLENFKTETLKNNLNKVEKFTESTFKQLIQKQIIKKISLNQDFEISVLNQRDQEEFGTLSQGETQLLALSFLAGMRNAVSRFDFPVIADTALSKLSEIPRLNMSKILPKAFNNKQLILLVTDTEFTEIVKENLGDKISDIHEIDFIEEDEISTFKRLEKYE